MKEFAEFDFWPWVLSDAAASLQGESILFAFQLYSHISVIHRVLHIIDADYELLCLIPQNAMSAKSKYSALLILTFSIQNLDGIV